MLYLIDQNGLFMKIFDNVTYDDDVNACYITLRNDVQIADTVESETDCWIDLAADGSIIGVEILNANLHFALINSILLSHTPVEQCVSYLSNHALLRAQQRGVTFEKVVECITQPD